MASQVMTLLAIMSQCHENTPSCSNFTSPSVSLFKRRGDIAAAWGISSYSLFLEGIIRCPAAHGVRRQGARACLVLRPVSPDDWCSVHNDISIFPLESWIMPCSCISTFGVDVSSFMWFVSMLSTLIGRRGAGESVGVGQGVTTSHTINAQTGKVWVEA